VDEITAAIKKLRATLGDSQQAFAHRLGLSVRAIANYEGGRRPSGPVLFDLSNLAEGDKIENLAKIFGAAYAKTVRGRIQPTTDQERVLVRIVLCLSRNQHCVLDWSRLATELVASLAALVSFARSNSSGLKTDLDELEDTLLEARERITPPAQRKLAKLARELSRGSQMPFDRAYLHVLGMHPELYAQYLEEMADANSAVRVYAKRKRLAEMREARKRKKSAGLRRNVHELD